MEQETAGLDLEMETAEGAKAMTEHQAAFDAALAKWQADPSAANYWDACAAEETLHSGKLFVSTYYKYDTTHREMKTGKP